jgi:hypothetical protein
MEWLVNLSHARNILIGASRLSFADDEDEDNAEMPCLSSMYMVCMSPTVVSDD